MAYTLSATPPSPNRPNDVKNVQTLLRKVMPPLSIQVGVTGTMDGNTLSAIRQFQSRFMKSPDSRVDPDGRTLWHLNEGFVAKYSSAVRSKSRSSMAI